jgi:single-strand DNA-binding protein
MINRIVLVGRLTRDPELRKTNSGLSVTTFTVAVDNRGRSGGEKTASFIPVVCWNQLAENVAKYTRKGVLVGVDGRLMQRSYERRDGTGRVQVFEVIADSVHFLEPKGDGGAPDVADDYSQTEDDSRNLDSIDIVGNDLPF